MKYGARSGDPVADIISLQDRSEVLAIMTDGVLRKAPVIDSARERLNLSVA